MVLSTINCYLGLCYIVLEAISLVHKMKTKTRILARTYIFDVVLWIMSRANKRVWRRSFIREARSKQLSLSSLFGIQLGEPTCLVFTASEEAEVVVDQELGQYRRP